MASVEVTSEMQSPEAPILGQDSTPWDYRHTPPSRFPSTLSAVQYKSL